MSTNFGSSPSRGKKRKRTSFGIFVRECRRHDVYSRLWTLRRVCYYPVLLGEGIKSRAKQAGAMKSCVFNDMHLAVEDLVLVK